MSATIVVKQCGIDNFEWLRTDESELDHQVSVGDAELLIEQCLSVNELVVLMPAEQVTLHEIPFERHERKMLRQTLPYSLEEDLVDDVDELHFALGDVSGETVALAVVAQEKMQEWLEPLQSQGADVDKVIPEVLLIPRADNSWSLLVDGQRWLVRNGDNQGFAMESANVSLALQLLMDASEQLPEALTVYCGEEDQDSINNQLPELLRGIVQWSRDDYWSMIDKGLQQPYQIDLLQGTYAPSLPWKKWWQVWRGAAVLLGVAVLVQFAVNVGQLQMLKSTNIDLRADIEKSYRSVVPKGAVMDAERQLRRKVNALKGGDGGGFVSLLAQVAQVLSAVDGLTLQSLNYAEKQSEIRLTVLAEDFDDVETARANIEKLGLTAELTGSSSEGGKTRARLRIRG